MGHYASEMSSQSEREATDMTHRVWAFTEYVKRGLSALRVSTYDKKPDDRHVQAKLRAEEAVMWAQAHFQYNESKPSMEFFQGPEFTIDPVTPDDVRQIANDLQVAWHKYEMGSWGHPHPGCPMQVTINSQILLIEDKRQIDLVLNAMRAALGMWEAPW